MRWRKIRNKKYSLKQEKKDIFLQSVPILWRFKAFIIDMFMIYIPILYITAYIILDGKDAFLKNNIAIFIDALLFGLILSLFLAFKGQTPGYKAYGIKLINKKNKKQPTFLKAFWRYFCFLISGASIIGLILCFFRKDKQNLHDILSKTITQKDNV